MKKLLSLLLVLVLLCSFFACAAPQPENGTDVPSSVPTATDLPTETDSAVFSSTQSDTTDVKTDKTEEAKPTLPDAADLYNLDFNEGNYVLAANQRGNTVLLYDLDFYEKNLESCMIWELRIGDSGGTNLSGIKFRKDTVYGDVVLVAASGGLAAIYKFPGRKKIWSVSSCGNNPHSIEILPNGAIVTAASTGKQIRVYDTSKAGDAGLCATYEYPDAHAVLWDPEYQILWALGSNKLTAYTFLPDGTGGTLKEKQVYTFSTTGGHELSADMSDKDYLLATTHTGVLRFNKKTGEFVSMQGDVEHDNCKGYGNNKLGNTVYCYPNGGEGTDWSDASFRDWCTDRIFFYDAKSKKLNELQSKFYAFYKVFSFCGDYQ